jgi:hypothetical protein
MSSDSQPCEPCVIGFRESDSAILLLPTRARQFV